VKSNEPLIGDAGRAVIHLEFGGRLDFVASGIDEPPRKPPPEVANGPTLQRDLRVYKREPPALGLPSPAWSSSPLHD